MESYPRKGWESVAWAPFEPIDSARRFVGEYFDLLGWGPVESPSRILLRSPVMTLRAYTEAQARGPVVLLVPAPIKRAYIWDLLPCASAIQELVRRGTRVYLMQWEAPGAHEESLGLAEYADRLIRRSLQALQKESGHSRVILVGHSLGGTFCAIFSALHPQAPAGLILLGAPLHFGPEVDALSFLVSRSPPAPILGALAGRISGSVLSVASLAASPTTFGYSRCRDWLASLSDGRAVRTHLAAERWTYDELPLPRRLFEEIVEWLYREDRFMRGRLEVSGRRAVPQQVVAPLLSIVEAQSEVVPPASVRPFYDAVSSSQKRWLLYEGDVGVSLQHLGMLVGKSAHEELWPIIVNWVRRFGCEHPKTRRAERGLWKGPSAV